MAAEERGDFVAIAAEGHGTPAAAMRAGIIIEEEAAGGIGAAADGRARAFDEEFGGGASEGGEQPIQAAFTGDELERPGPFVRDELVVAFGDAKDFIDRLDPGSGKGLFVDDGAEDGAERFPQTENAEKNGVHGLRFGGEKGTETSSTILGDQAGIEKERHEFIPGKIVSEGREVGEIEGEAAGNEVGSGFGHVTSLFLQGGYSRNWEMCKMEAFTQGT